MIGEWTVENLYTTPQNLVPPNGENVGAALIDFLTFPNGEILNYGGSNAPLYCGAISEFLDKTYIHEPTLTARGNQSYLALPTCNGLKVWARTDLLKVRVQLFKATAPAANQIDERIEVKFMPGSQASLYRVRVKKINDVNYWETNAGTSEDALVYLATGPEFVAGAYDVYAAGRDTANGEARLRLSINGEQVYERFAASPFDTNYEVKVLENQPLMPNTAITIGIYKGGNDRGSISSIRLVPV